MYMKNIQFTQTKKKKTWLNNSLEYNLSHQISTYNVKKKKKCNREIKTWIRAQLWDFNNWGAAFFFLNSSFSKRNTTLITTQSKIKTHQCTRVFFYLLLFIWAGNPSSYSKSSNHRTPKKKSLTHSALVLNCMKCDAENIYSKSHSLHKVCIVEIKGIAQLY